VSTNADKAYNPTFNGARGGAGEPLRDFEVWNFTYVMPEDFVGTPWLGLEVAVK